MRVKVARVGAGGGVDFVVAGGAFHEDHAAAGLDEGGDEFEGGGNLGDSACDDALGEAGEAWSDLAGVDLDIFEAEGGDGVVEEFGASASGLGEDHGDVGAGDFEGDSGQAGAGAHIDKGRGKSGVIENKKAIDVVLEHHVFEVTDAGEVEPRVGFAEQAVVVPELVDLLGRKVDSAVGEEGFEGFTVGGHGG